MLLNFLGKGSGFNPKLGNTSAYIKSGSSMLLLDCGGTIFSKLVEIDETGNCLLSDVKSLVVVITHLHDDHIGSLSSLILYCRYVLNIMPIIAYPNPVEIFYLLYNMGIRESLFKITQLNLENQTGFKLNDLTIFIEPIPVLHTLDLASYGYLIEKRDGLNNEMIYYSGDSNNIPVKIYKAFETGKINEFYQDISGRDSSITEFFPHMKYQELLSVIPQELRSKIYLMHQDIEFESIKNTAIADGFEVI